MNKFLTSVVFAVLAACNFNANGMQSSEARQREALLGLTSRADAAIALKLDELEHSLLVNGKKDADLTRQVTELREMVKTLQAQTKRTHKLRNTILILTTLAVIAQLGYSGYNTYKKVQAKKADSVLVVTSGSLELGGLKASWGSSMTKTLSTYFKTVLGDVQDEFDWCCDHAKSVFKKTTTTSSAPSPLG